MGKHCTMFSDLGIGDRFMFRQILIGRRQVKTGTYSFVSAKEFGERGGRITEEEILVGDFHVTKIGDAPKAITVDDETTLAWD